MLTAILWNALVAGVLAVVVGVAAGLPWLRRRPGVVHVLWMIVLLKFLTPAFIPVPVLPGKLTTAVAPVPRSPDEFTLTVRKGVDSNAPFLTTRNAPPCCATKMRPSGATAIAV